MEHPTTGKRHARAGSVHVTELIGRRLPAFDLPDDAATTDVVDLCGPDLGEPRPTQSRMANAGKIVALAVATMTLCGAIGTAAMLTRDRAPASAPAVRQAAEITGDRALLPDELNRAVDKTAPQKTKTSTDKGTAKATAGSATATQADATTTTGKTEAGKTEAAKPAKSDQRDKYKGAERPKTSHRDLVREYYRLIGSDPARAFDLLSGQAFGTSLVEFIGSWASVLQVDVLTVEDTANGVLATVTMQLVGGGQLRITQLLRVADTVPQRIVGAELVSAQLK